MPRTIHPPIFKATFRIREAYGNVRAYPVTREATLLCNLAGTKTLRAQDIDTIRELGFECIDTEGDVIHAIDLYWEPQMTDLDAYFDRMLDAHLEEYFEDRENAWEGLTDDEDFNDDD